MERVDVEKDVKKFEMCGVRRERSLDSKEDWRRVCCWREVWIWVRRVVSWDWIWVVCDEEDGGRGCFSLMSGGEVDVVGW
jgi:hypothetical protein